MSRTRKNRRGGCPDGLSTTCVSEKDPNDKKEPNKVGKFKYCSNGYTRQCLPKHELPNDDGPNVVLHPWNYSSVGGRRRSRRSRRSRR